MDKLFIIYIMDINKSNNLNNFAISINISIYQNLYLLIIPIIILLTLFYISTPFIYSLCYLLFLLPLYHNQYLSCPTPSNDVFGPLLTDADKNLQKKTI
jgi:hypothetical protein